MIEFGALDAVLQAYLVIVSSSFVVLQRIFALFVLFLILVNTFIEASELHLFELFGVGLDHKFVVVEPDEVLSVDEVHRSEQSREIQGPVVQLDRLKRGQAAQSVHERQRAELLFKP